MRGFVLNLRIIANTNSNEMKKFATKVEEQNYIKNEKNRNVLREVLVKSVINKSHIFTSTKLSPKNVESIANVRSVKL